VINDEQLGIDTGACDGCDLCIPACPEAAISNSQRAEHAEVHQIDGRPVIFYACEYTGLDAGAAQMPCVHAIGLRDLLHEYRRECRTWVISMGDCDTCPRGRVQRLTETVQQANRLLQSRELPVMLLLAIEPTRWLALFQESREYRQEPQLGRRDFLFSALRHTLNTAIEAASLADSEKPAISSDSPAAWLPATGPNDLFLHSPVIDPARCNGCDACVQLCPHAAIVLERGDNSLCYRIESQQCTGCGICRDSCDQQAIQILSHSTRLQSTVTLAEERCPACEIRYHVPVEQRREDKLCAICARTSHRRHLYQVLK
jgi:Pyruvate/2-oxoacid:ferredoxin oxidoreductase delta subunit